jgi:hypothetical protein
VGGRTRRTESIECKGGPERNGESLSFNLHRAHNNQLDTSANGSPTMIPIHCRDRDLNRGSFFRTERGSSLGRGPGGSGGVAGWGGRGLSRVVGLGLERAGLGFRDCVCGVCRWGRGGGRGSGSLVVEGLGVAVAVAGFVVAFVVAFVGSGACLFEEDFLVELRGADLCNELEARAVNDDVRDADHSCVLKGENGDADVIDLHNIVGASALWTCLWDIVLVSPL